MNDVIELNNHRLLNGDATNKADVNRLLKKDIGIMSEKDKQN